MDSLDTHPMPLGEPLLRAPRTLRRVTPWADNVSQPWSETMPASKLDPATPRRVAPTRRRIVVWALAAVLLALAAYALRAMLRR